MDHHMSRYVTSIRLEHLRIRPFGVLFHNLALRTSICLLTVSPTIIRTKQTITTIAVILYHHQQLEHTAYYTTDCPDSPKKKSKNKSSAATVSRHSIDSQMYVAAYSQPTENAPYCKCAKLFFTSKL